MVLAKRGLLSVSLVVVMAGVGCKKEPELTIAPDVGKDYTAALPPGELALVKLTDPAMFPDFSEGYYSKAGLDESAAYSLEYLSRPSSQNFFPYGDISHERAVASIEAFREVLKTAKSPQELDQMIKSRFDIYQSRGCDEKGTVLFTGYYRPIFDCRLQPDAQFRFPLYKKPPELVQDPATGQYMKQGGGAYYTRGEIDNGALRNRGLELCYLKDRFEAYIVTVQGSGKLRLPSGEFFEIGYAGDNGHEYTSVGQELVKKGVIRVEELSLQGLIDFFNRHPEELEPALSVNDRYVFFTPRSGGPYGSLNVPVTPYRTIATDKEVYPRACPAYLVTVLPARGEGGRIGKFQYAGFAMDQDTGGAIRAAGRCDIFLGTGPEVGELAGRTFDEGKLYYIFLKE